MPIKTRIDRNGLKQIGNDTGFELKPMATSVGVFPFQQYTQNVGTAFTASTPGFYFVSGSTQCTGTLPSASSQPGSMFMFTLTNNMPMRLTCSVRSLSYVPNFARNDISASAGGPGQLVSDRNDGLALSASGSVMVQSNGFVWQPVVASGSVTLVAAGGLIGI